MKKNYLAPSTEISNIELQQMMVGSGVRSEGDFDITYGGVDEDGTKDPSSRRNNVWEEEEEEEY